MTVPPNIDLSPELRALIEESVQNFTAQLKLGTGPFYAMIDSKGWIEQYRAEVTRVIRRTKNIVGLPHHEVKG